MEIYIYGSERWGVTELETVSEDMEWNNSNHAAFLFSTSVVFEYNHMQTNKKCK